MDIFHPKKISFTVILYHVFTLEKCGFHQSKVEFLGYIISRDGVRTDLRKVQTIMDWVTPICIRNVQ
jgi:hypothetical protein